MSSRFVDGSIGIVGIGGCLRRVIHSFCYPSTTIIIISIIIIILTFTNITTSRIFIIVLSRGLDEFMEGSRRPEPEILRGWTFQV